MTHKAVRYSKHALMRLQQRAITRAMVRRALAIGEKITDTGVPDTRAARLKVDRDMLQVHYREGATGIFIITAYWEDDA